MPIYFRRRQKVIKALWEYVILVKRAERRVGKLLQFPDGKIVFYRSYRFNSAFFQKDGSLSFDELLLPELINNHVSEIHYEDNEGRLWVTTVQVMMAEGQRGEGHLLHLPLTRWISKPRWYRAGWTNKEIRLARKLKPLDPEERAQAEADYRTILERMRQKEEAEKTAGSNNAQ